MEPLEHPPPANMPNGLGLPPLDPTPLPVRFARAVLLFHRGGPWTAEDHDQWARLTGTWLCTAKNLCDLGRQVEASMGPALAQARLQALREAEAVVAPLNCPEASSAILRLREGHSEEDPHG